MSWRGVIAALDPAASYRSRIAVYHHPLAGRPVLWHIIAAMTSVEPRPERITVLHREGTPPVVPPDIGVPVGSEAVAAGDEIQAVQRAVAGPGPCLLVDGRAPLLDAPSLVRLLRAAGDGIVALGDGRSEIPPLALAGEGIALAALEDVWHAPAIPRLAPGNDHELLRIDDRATFADAAVAMRDRLIARLQALGVSFLLPATIWLDVDVLIGADSLIYPGVILEGATEIGSECVIGPHCRIIESRIGRGVELKGWNYVTRTSIRNHAVLEPYVRRGHD